MRGPLDACALPGAGVQRTRLWNGACRSEPGTRRRTACSTSGRCVELAFQPLPAARAAGCEMLTGLVRATTTPGRSPAPRPQRRCMGCIKHRMQCLKAAAGACRAAWGCMRRHLQPGSRRSKGRPSGHARPPPRRHGWRPPLRSTASHMSRPVHVRPPAAAGPISRGRARGGGRVACRLDC